LTQLPAPEDALAEARDLDFVCRPRTAPAHEIFQPNAYYGNDLVLKLYAGLAPDRPLKVVVPHGIVYNESYVWEAERQAPLPAVLVYSAHRARAYRQATRKLQIRSAVPFAYLARLLGDAGPAARTGTLFFPAHSSHRTTTQGNFAGMAEALTRFDARYQPITVCIYWRDYEMQYHRAFLDRGLRVVSAGHMFDPSFLYRLYHLCRTHRYAAGVHAGSSLPFSVLAGCRWFRLRGFDMTYSGQHAHLAADFSGRGAPLDAMEQVFAEPVEEITARQSALVGEICGLDSLLGPTELRSVLEMADRLDRFGLARHPGDRRVYVTLPRMPLRAPRSVARTARNLVRKLREVRS
jgi:hypothetical protein